MEWAAITLKPYQGLKRRKRTRASPLMGRNHTKTLLGIETQKFLGLVYPIHAAITLKPYQGLKLYL